jgi:glycosyltransferase involved in cell wall biosynthesis
MVSFSDPSAPSVVLVMPDTSLHGGNRIPLELGQRLQRCGYRVVVVSPAPPPSWHRLEVEYRQLDVYRSGALPEADIAIGTYYPTVGPAFGSGARHVFHLCQGYEGVHREFAERLPAIDSAYRLPIPKLLVSAHLQPVLEERYGARCHVIGQAVDQEIFRPAPSPEDAGPLRIGVVGPFGIRPKGIGEALQGLALARAAGQALEVHRAAAAPLSEEEARLGVTDRYHHGLSTEQMAEFYRGLDAYVHPSHDEEGFPLPPLEAMACGVPVAVSRIRSFAVLPDAAVLRFPPGRPEALVPIVAQLARPERRRELRARGLEVVRAYTFDRVIGRLLAAFEEEGAPLPVGLPTPV